MSTLTKPKKPAPRRIAKSVKRPVRSLPTPASPRLVPPPGKSAREIMANYPEPSKDFDAKGVMAIHAKRAIR